SLATDYGRVQLAKTQILAAADAAGRAAAAAFSGGVSAAQDAAVAAAADNSADGSSVVIDPNNDVEFGSWDSSAATFTALSCAASGRSVSVGSGCTVPGSTAPLNADLTYPLGSAGSYAAVNGDALVPSHYLDSSKNFTMASGVTLTLPGGHYWFNKCILNSG